MEQPNLSSMLLYNTRGIASVSQNFLIVMNKDPFYKDIRLNLLTGRPETKWDSRVWRSWTDADAAKSRCYIEENYMMHSKQKHEDAFLCMLNNRAYHPIKPLIEESKWDGVHRISQFLTTWMGCEDSPYTMEVSRLIFAGGIHRLYHPGSKFDDMPVLVGIQGCGKSSIVRWLALKDSFFREVNEFEGQKGMEALEGAWICEVSELLAMTKAREQEAVKSYLTRLVDTYRRPFDRFVTEHPRECVFIGTTNKQQFLADKTGGRRFYPVQCHGDGYALHDQKAACMACIRQCWAEALAKINDPFMSPFANRQVLNVVREAQDAATEDDARVGLIEAYLANKDMVCGMELWQRALGMECTLPDRKEFADIALIMQNMGSWERINHPRAFGSYGKQKYWQRKT